MLLKQGEKILAAAEKGRLIKLINLLKDYPSLVNYKDSDGYTPLHRASYGGKLDCAKYLVRHGANIEAQTSEDWTPLHCAVRWNNMTIVEFLLSQGSNINAKSNGGNTPLHVVSSNGRYLVTCDIIQLLLFHESCDFKAKNHSNDTAYELAKRSGPLYRLWVGVMTIIPDDYYRNESDEIIRK